MKLAVAISAAMLATCSAASASSPAGAHTGSTAVRSGVRVAAEAPEAGQYSLIPLLGDRAPIGRRVRLDESGSVAALLEQEFFYPYTSGFRLYDVRGPMSELIVPAIQPLGIPGFAFSADGHRVVYASGMLIFYDLIVRGTKLGPDGIAAPPSSFTDEAVSFSVSRTADLVALVSSSDLDPHVGNPDGLPQYFLYDRPARTSHQITADPHAFEPGEGSPCHGSLPALTRGGDLVVFASPADLGVTPAEAPAGCRVFAYDVGEARLRYVATIPGGGGFDVDSVSDDGRWLTFVTPPPRQSAQPRAMRLDLAAASFEDVGGDLPAFDAVVSGDGSHVVFSSRADLDPAVGNGDANSELFAIDVASGVVSQVTDTTGGVCSNGPCRYLPAVNVDGSVIAFGFTADPDTDPQRSRGDGLRFANVRAVRRRPGNAPVVLSVTAAQVELAQEQEVTIPLAAIDDDGDAVTLFVQAVDARRFQPQIELTDRGDGTGEVRVSAGFSPSGGYDLAVAAFDEGGGEDVHHVHIVVHAAPGDANCDGESRADDVAAAISLLFDPLSALCDAIDQNEDGRINVADLLKVVAAQALPRVQP